MKIKYFYLVLSVLFFSSCWKDEVTVEGTYEINSPILAKASELRASVKVVEPVKINKTGKIIQYNGFLYISEYRKGIHVINNREPANPIKQSFINLPGHTDFTIQEGNIYTNSYNDLVCFDISSPLEPKPKNTIQNRFVNLPATGNDLGIDWTRGEPENVVIGWQTITKLIKGDYQPQSFKNGLDVSFDTTSNHLYACNYECLFIFEIGANLNMVGYPNLPSGKIQIKNHKVLIQNDYSATMYSLADPVNPQKKSFIDKLWQCSPIAFDGTTIYSTSYEGGKCGQNENLLYTYNTTEPKGSLIASQKMTSPKGLCVYNNNLFVCDNGLKVYNVNDKLSENMAYYPEVKGNNIFVFDNLLVLTTDDGIYQYMYTEGKIALLNIHPIN